MRRIIDRPGEVIRARLAWLMLGLFFLVPWTVLGYSLREYPVLFLAYESMSLGLFFGYWRSAAARYPSLISLAQAVAGLVLMLKLMFLALELGSFELSARVFMLAVLAAILFSLFYEVGRQIYREKVVEVDLSCFDE
ncbi:MAG: hypothetical protein D6719_12270 [Candidatus Dadabacteria bacterium]|nr:MAG: hypothetical protein D6719_12270 [Candidatus Dadabacteria bacterium]